MGNDFRQRVEQAGCQILQLEELKTMQVNMGNICNQHCSHCHINAGPEGKNIMTKQRSKGLSQVTLGTE